MQAENTHLKGAAKASLGLLLLLLVGAFIFYRERMFTDAAFVVFHIINHGSVEIQVERYGSFITQILPAVAVNLHLPIKAILIIYSVSFNLFYFGTALLLFYKFRDYALVILMGFYYSLYVTESYFWTNIELHQAVCWMFMMFGFIKYFSARQAIRGNKIDLVTGVLVFLTLAFFAIFTHPAAVFPLLFLWVFYWIRGKEAPFNKPSTAIFYLLLILAIFGVKYLISINAVGYDSQMTATLIKSSPIDWWNTFTSGTADRFWKSISRRNWLMPIMFLISLVVLLREKKFMQFSWVLISSIGYFIILCLTFSVEVDFYIESEFLPLTIFGTSAFVYYVLPKISKARTVTTLLLGVYVIRVCFILYFSQEFMQRVNRVDEALAYMRQEGIHKMIILKENENFELELISTGWGLTYESLLHSNMHGDGTTLSFLNIDKETMAKYPIRDSLRDLRETFGSFPKGSLNSYYFKPDSTQPYVIKTYNEVFKSR